MNKCPNCGEESDFNLEFKCKKCGERFWENEEAYKNNLNKLKKRLVSKYEMDQESDISSSSQPTFSQSKRTMQYILGGITIFIILIILNLDFENKNPVDLDFESKTYPEKCKAELLLIGDHIEDIGVVEGIFEDPLGRKISRYSFANEDINLFIVDKAYLRINNIYKQFLNDLDDGQNSTKQEAQDLYNCYKSAVFFVYPEKIERALFDGEYSKVADLLNDIKNFSNDDWFLKMLNNSSDSQKEETDFEKYQNLLLVVDDYQNFSSLLEDLNYKEKLIEKSDKAFLEFETQGDAVSYDLLVPKYNSLLLKYENNIKELENDYGEEWEKESYKTYIDLVEVYLIFPAQTDIKLVDSED